MRRSTVVGTSTRSVDEGANRRDAEEHVRKVTPHHLIYRIERVGDHVLPVTQFPKRRPERRLALSSPPAVPAIMSSPKFRDYLRDWLAIDFRSRSNPAAHQLLEGPVEWAVGYGSSKLARAAQQQGRREPFYTSGRVYLGQVYTVPFYAEWKNYVFSMMAWGLYYSRFGKRLPDDYVVTVAGSDPHNLLA